MSLSQGLRWSGRGISSGRHRIGMKATGVRQYSLRASPNGATLYSSPSSLRTVPHRSPLLTQQSRSLSLFGWGSKSTGGDDFAKAHSTSTSSDLPGRVQPIKASHATSDAPDPSSAHLHLPNEHTPEALQRLENAIVNPHGVQDAVAVPDMASIPEGIGYLKNVCGLDFGWGPTAFMEFMLEHLHISAGLSWSASIIGLTLIYRLAILYPSIVSTRENAKMREISPILKPLQEKSRLALQQRDRATAMSVQQEMVAIRKESGFSFFRMLAPIFIQFPIQYGGFRLLSAMGSLPVPALQTEHFLWLTNLSTSDPYYLLPLSVGVMTYLNITTAAKLQPENKVMEVLTKVLPIMSIIFVSFQPSSVGLFFLMNGFTTQLQQKLLNSPAVRARLGMPPLGDLLSARTRSPTAPTSPSYRADMRITRPSESSYSSSPSPSSSSSKSPETPYVSPNRSTLDKLVDSAKGTVGKAVGNPITGARNFLKKSSDETAQKQADRAQAKWEARRVEELEAARRQRNSENKR